MMTTRVRAEIHPYMVNSRPVIVIGIKEDKVSDAKLGEVLNLIP